MNLLYFTIVVTILLTPKLIDCRKHLNTNRPKYVYIRGPQFKGFYNRYKRDHSMHKSNPVNQAASSAADESLHNKNPVDHATSILTTEVLEENGDTQGFNDYNDIDGSNYIPERIPTRNTHIPYKYERIPTRNTGSPYKYEGIPTINTGIPYQTDTGSLQKPNYCQPGLIPRYRFAKGIECSTANFHTKGTVNKLNGLPNLYNHGQGSKIRNEFTTVPNLPSNNFLPHQNTMVSSLILRPSPLPPPRSLPSQFYLDKALEVDFGPFSRKVEFGKLDNMIKEHESMYKPFEYVPVRFSKIIPPESDFPSKINTQITKPKPQITNSHYKPNSHKTEQSQTAHQNRFPQQEIQHNSGSLPSSIHEDPKFVGTSHHYETYHSSEKLSSSVHEDPKYVESSPNHETYHSSENLPTSIQEDAKYVETSQDEYVDYDYKDTQNLPSTIENGQSNKQDSHENTKYSNNVINAQHTYISSYEEGQNHDSYPDRHKYNNIIVQNTYKSSHEDDQNQESSFPDRHEYNKINAQNIYSSSFENVQNHHTSPEPQNYNKINDQNAYKSSHEVDKNHDSYSDRHKYNKINAQNTHEDFQNHHTSPERQKYNKLKGQNDHKSSYGDGQIHDSYPHRLKDTKLNGQNTYVTSYEDYQNDGSSERQKYNKINGQNTYKSSNEDGQNHESYPDRHQYNNINDQNAYKSSHEDSQNYETSSHPKYNKINDQNTYQSSNEEGQNHASYLDRHQYNKINDQNAYKSSREDYQNYDTSSRPKYNKNKGQNIYKSSNEDAKNQDSYPHRPKDTKINGQNTYSASNEDQNTYQSGYEDEQNTYIGSYEDDQTHDGTSSHHQRGTYFYESQSTPNQSSEHPNQDSMSSEQIYTTRTTIYYSDPLTNSNREVSRKNPRTYQIKPKYRSSRNSRYPRMVEAVNKTFLPIKRIWDTQISLAKIQNKPTTRTNKSGNFYFRPFKKSFQHSLIQFPSSFDEIMNKNWKK